MESGTHHGRYQVRKSNLAKYHIFYCYAFTYYVRQTSKNSIAYCDS